MEQDTFNITNYLTGRCISSRVAEYSNIHVRDNKIAIPVFDRGGNFLFHKYRKLPTDTNPNTPKYLYEKGSTYSVYGYFPDYQYDTKEVYFVEGEFDALVLQSKGKHALTSTGGCGSFKKEWLDPYEEIYICMDGDDAGKRASAKIALSIQKKCKIYIMNGMDITEFFQEGYSMDKFLSLSTIDYEPPKADTKKAYKTTIDDLVHQRRTLLQFAEDTFIIDNIIEVLVDRYKSFNKKKTPNGYSETSYDIETLKRVPISNFIKFGRNNKAKSIFKQDDKTPSMHYYEEENRVFCFATSKGGDVIDVVMTIHNCSFKEAVDIISRYL